MSALPLMLRGESISALVVGGGRVATRRALALLDSGARVRVLAPRVSHELEHRAESDRSLVLTIGSYDPSYLDDVILVVAATDDPAVNQQVAEDARNAAKLVNVVDDPDLGNCVTPAVHRAGDVVVAVTAGGVPGAAARIRDAIARTLDGRYAAAVRELAMLRRGLLDTGDRERWREASASLVGADFCEQVESGRFEARVAEWR